jgi:para-aminobenzoate synthetase/4-amino-4-deoxychorismate lyase
MGIFETLLVRHGRPVELDAHLERMEHSLRALYAMALPGAARDLVLGRAEDLALGRLRLDVAPGVPGAVRAAPVDPALIFPGWRGALRLRRLAMPGGLGPHKWADRRALAAAEADAAAVPLLVDADGSILEASRGNVFLVRDGTLLTPPADGRILPGITRGRVIELALDAGIPVEERGLVPADLDAADEAFVTGAVRGIEPVRAWEGGERTAEGPVTGTLAARLQALWESTMIEEAAR